MTRIELEQWLLHNGFKQIAVVSYERMQIVVNLGDNAFAITTTHQYNEYAYADCTMRADGIHHADGRLLRGHLMADGIAISVESLRAWFAQQADCTIVVDWHDGFVAVRDDLAYHVSSNYLTMRDRGKRAIKDNDDLTTKIEKTCVGTVHYSAPFNQLFLRDNKIVRVQTLLTPKK